MGVNITKQGIITSSGSTVNDNLLLNSATLTGKNGSTVSNNITTGTHNGTSGWSEAYWPISQSASGNPLSNQQVTISLDFKTTDTSKTGAMYFGFGEWNSANSRVADMNIAVSTYTVISGTMANNQWCRIAYTLTVPTTWTTDAATYKLQIKTAAGAEGAVMYHKRIKVELGNKPTAWTISSSDAGFKVNGAFCENIEASFIPAKIGSDWIQSSEIIEV